MHDDSKFELGAVKHSVLDKYLPVPVATCCMLTLCSGTLWLFSIFLVEIILHLITSVRHFQSLTWISKHTLLCVQFLKYLLTFASSLIEVSVLSSPFTCSPVEQNVLIQYNFNYKYTSINWLLDYPNLKVTHVVRFTANTSICQHVHQCSCF